MELVQNLIKPKDKNNTTNDGGCSSDVDNLIAYEKLANKV